MHFTQNSSNKQTQSTPGQHKSTHRKARLEPAIRDAQKLAQDVFPPWRFASYLTDRTQTTQVEASISTKGKILFGVSQGSVLGLLLFLIYINDIYRVSSKLNFYLFADDTNILCANNNLKSLESVVNEELRKVCEWLNTNKLSLNTSKSNFVLFHPFQRYNVTLKIYDNDLKILTSLEQKHYVKYLGVLIDSHLSWRYHMDYIQLYISQK